MSSHGILKLNIDCLEELFEWLSLADLFSLRQTCTRLKHVVDYHIRTNYPVLQYEKSQTDGDFAQFCQIEPTSINTVNILSEAKDRRQAEKIDQILKQAVSITVRYDQFEGDFYGVFLKYCQQRKSVTILFIYGDNPMETSNEWLLRSYPMLRHISFEDTDISGAGFAEKVVELKAFFELNPNVCSFSMSSHFLEQNGDCLKRTNVQLDQLTIHSDCYRENGMNGICNLLKELHRQGFYRRLHLYGSFIFSKEDLDEMFSVPAEKLYLGCFDRDIEFSLPLMPELVELGVSFSGEIKNLEQMAKSLMNITRIYIKHGSVDDLALFIRHSAKVKQIKINSLDKGQNNNKGNNNKGHFFNNTIIDLPALNRERRLLRGACKIRIYVNESIYLATKWATMNTDFDLVELKRGQAYEWKHGN